MSPAPPVTSTWAEVVVMIEQAPYTLNADVVMVVGMHGAHRSCGLQNDAGDVIHILLVHGGVIGQEEPAMMNTVGHRKTGFPVTVHPEGVKPQIAGGEHACLNAFRHERVDDASPLFHRICEQAEGDAGHLAALRRPLSIKTCSEMLQIPIVIRLPPARHPVELAELFDTDEGIEIRRAQVETRFVKHEGGMKIVDLIVRDQFLVRRRIEVFTPPMASQHEEEIREPFVAGRNHAAFDGGHLMTEIKGEARHVAEGPHLLSLIFRPDGCAGILEQIEPISILDRKSTRLNSSHQKISYA